MSTNMLAARFRPKTFDKVHGQQHVVGPIKDAIKLKSLSRTLLLYGPSGTGKTTIARIIAKSLNCLDSKDGEPCGACKSCRSLDSNNSMDLLEFDAATNGGINEIRAIQEQVQAASLSTRFRVFLLDEAHALTSQASNALLKTLEEPPSNVIFILATTEPNKILATIRTRCQKYGLSPLTIPEIKSCLEDIAKSLEVIIDNQALELMARGSRGGMREAIQFLEKIVSTQEKKTVSLKDVVDSFGAVSFQLVFSFFSHVAGKKYGSILSYIESMVQDGVGLTSFWSDFQQLLRSLTFARHMGNDSELLKKLLQYDESSLAAIVRSAKSLNQTALLDAWKAAIETQNILDSPAVAGRGREIIEETALRIANFLSAQPKQVAELPEVAVPAVNATQEKIVQESPHQRGALPIFGNRFIAL